MTKLNKEFKMCDNCTEKFKYMECKKIESLQKGETRQDKMKRYLEKKTSGRKT